MSERKITPVSIWSLDAFEAAKRTLFRRPLISQIRFDVVFYQIYTLYTGGRNDQKKEKAVQM